MPVLLSRSMPHLSDQAIASRLPLQVKQLICCAPGFTSMPHNCMIYAGADGARVQGLAQLGHHSVLLDVEHGPVPGRGASVVCHRRLQQSRQHLPDLQLQQLVTSLTVAPCIAAPGQPAHHQ